MNIVLFLGAGFSAPFDLPTLNRFSEEVSTNSNLTDRDRALFRTLKLNVQRANSFLESTSTNLEDILSFFAMGDRLQTFDDGLSVPSTEVKSIIAKVYSTLKRPDHYWDELDSFKSFLQSDIQTLIREGHKLNIITTNYDLVIDSILFSQKMDAEFPFDFNTTSKGNGYTLYGINAVPLFKLHGSINWFFQDQNGNEQILLEDRVVPNPDKLDTLIPASCTNHSYVGSPIIIPPTYLKPELPHQLVNVWSKASKAIEHAEMIIFIGYSFPSTDTEMRYFLAGSLAENTMLQKIKVFDLYASQIVDDLRASKSGYGSYFKKLLEPIDGNWIEQKLGLFKSETPITGRRT